MSDLDEEIDDAKQSLTAFKPAQRIRAISEYKINPNKHSINHSTISAHKSGISNPSDFF